MAKYCFVIEKSGNGYSAYVPDLPGCIAAGDTREETETLIREGIVIYLNDIREQGEPIPEPKTEAAFVEA